MLYHDQVYGGTNSREITNKGSYLIIYTCIRSLS